MTNYSHSHCGIQIFGSLLREFGYFYKFSQQGWEALNQKRKKVYHKNTNHRGNIGGNTKLRHTGTHEASLDVLFQVCHVEDRFGGQVFLQIRIYKRTKMLMRLNRE